MNIKSLHIYSFLAIVISLAVLSCSTIGGPEFETILNVSISPDGSGSVEPSQGSYKKGVELELTATASPGWKFDGWTGDTTASGNPLKVTMDSDKSLTANFIQFQNNFENTVTVTDGTSTMDLVMGMNENATDGYDDGIDKELPPPPPDGSFYAMFTIENYNLSKDIKALSSSETVWQLEFSPEEGNTITLNWDFSQSSHSGTLLLVDDPDNPTFEIDMKSETSYQVSDTTVNTLYIISKP